MAAELSELGKRPVAPDTHLRLVSLNKRLDALMNEFVMCERCGNLFPHVAQLTLDGRTANLCTACGIIALQKGAIELHGKQDIPARTAASSSRSPEKPSPPPKPPRTKVRAGEDAGEPTEIPPGQKSSPRASLRVTSTFRKRGTEPNPDEGRDAEPKTRRSPEAPTGETGHPTNAPPAAPEATSEQETPTSESARDPDVETAGPVPRRTAKRPRSDESLFKATVPEVAKSLKRSTREVRQIRKLIEEISPPMDTKKTTRYVLAELRNARSKIPVEIVSQVVERLKEGIPGGDSHGGAG